MCMQKTPTKAWLLEATANRARHIHCDGMSRHSDPRVLANVLEFNYGYEKCSKKRSTRLQWTPYYLHSSTGSIIFVLLSFKIQDRSIETLKHVLYAAHETLALSHCSLITYNGPLEHCVLAIRLKQKPRSVLTVFLATHPRARLNITSACNEIRY